VSLEAALQSQPTSKSFDLEPFQIRFVFTDATYPAFVAGWGTGKSLCLILRTIIRCERYPRNLALIGREKFVELRDSTMKDFYEYTGIPINANGDAKLSNGSIIMFRHADQFTKLQNINLGVAALEQAEEFKDDGPWLMLHGRMRRKDVGGPSLFLIANTAGNNWIKKLWKDRTVSTIKRWSDTAAVYEGPFGYELIEAGPYDCMHYLEPGFKKVLEDTKHISIERYNQYVLNSWDVLSGRIFGMWDESYHVIPDMNLPEEWETVGSIDPAVTTGTFAAVIAKVSPQGDVIIIGEYYEKGRIISEHMKGIKKLTDQLKVKPASWICDPSAFIKNQQRPKQGGFYALVEEMEPYDIFPRRGENAVNAGINHMAEYLNINYGKKHPFSSNLKGSPRFFVMNRCQNFRKEISVYRESPNRLTDRGMSKWSVYKHFDHLMDCARYLLMSRLIGVETPSGEVVIPRFSVAEIERQIKQEQYSIQEWW